MLKITQNQNNIKHVYKKVNIYRQKDGILAFRCDHRNKVKRVTRNILKKANRQGELSTIDLRSMLASTRGPYFMYFSVKIVSKVLNMISAKAARECAFFLAIFHSFMTILNSSDSMSSFSSSVSWLSS